MTQIADAVQMGLGSWDTSLVVLALAVPEPRDTAPVAFRAITAHCTTVGVAISTYGYSVWACVGIRSRIDS